MYVTKVAIEEVRRRCDLVQVVEGRGVALERRGRNFVGLCPFHEDREPSLVVNPERQLWNCFGACAGNGGKSGGDVFAFVAKKDGVTFLEAMKRLGYEEPRRGAGPVAAPGPRPTAPASPDLLARVAAHYHRTFRERPEGQAYLRTRGLIDAAMFEAFEVGYVDGSLPGTVDAGTRRALVAAGVLNARGRELFLGCVVFPLSLPDVGVVGLYGRNVQRDQHLYLPGPRRGVFHRQAMKGSGHVVLTESVIDALTLYQSGIRNVSCVYGVQRLTADHEELLQRYRVRRVTLLLDNDDAGEQARQTIGDRLRPCGLDINAAWIEGAKDANELLVSQGASAAAAFRRALALPLTAGTTCGRRQAGPTGRCGCTSDNCWTSSTSSSPAAGTGSG